MNTTIDLNEALKDVMYVPKGSSNLQETDKCCAIITCHWCPAFNSPHGSTGPAIYIEIPQLIIYLEVDDNQEDGNGGQQISAVGQVVPVESLLQSSHFVPSLHQQLEESDDSSFKLRTLGSRDGVRAECLPDDVLTDVGSNEQGDTRPQTISLLEHFI